MKHDNEVKWILTKKELSSEEILTVEKKLDISFPSDFVECAKLNNGGQPVPDTFDLQGRRGAVFNALLSLNIDESRNILSVYENIKTRLPRNIYPFADDPFGNYLCFDYRDSTSPVVVFWDHEHADNGQAAALSYVCNSFSQLLNKLYE
ncbi:SMI1/KNR4 family protein [Paenibacillus sp. NRS-1760]|uniref:SMI1/KNR4 family protein n=1 Tax=Paenibacillus sp. NRS-1760 TaxID=3233902 RepID=UPI003D288DDA